MCTFFVARNNEIVISVRASDECDMRRDVLLIEDMSSETAYLQCKPAGRGYVFNYISD